MSWIDQRPDGAIETAGTGQLNTIEAALFREAMARLGAAVHVVTTAGPGGKTGFTATAVISVSDQPATLLVCLNRQSRIMPVLQQNNVLCVNTLRADAEKIADVFAGRTGSFMEERFQHGKWMTLKTGAPVLESAIIAFDCRIFEVKTIASHNVYFCAVEAIRQGPPGPALVYHERAYKQV
ncbi:MAG: flavin reductase [Xanthobacteraceae bacterium]|nr:flavin reductase [Xanthobacteraceae bacterium]